MPKHLGDNRKVVVDGYDLSSFADSVDTPSEKAQIDVSGFGGTREYLPGQEDSTITVEFFVGHGSAEPNWVLGSLYSSGSHFPVYVQEDADAGTTSENPVYGGIAALYGYNSVPGALGEAAKFSVDFKPAPGYAFAEGTVAP